MHNYTPNPVIRQRFGDYVKQSLTCYHLRKYTAGTLFGQLRGYEGKHGGIGDQ